MSEANFFVLYLFLDYISGLPLIAGQLCWPEGTNLRFYVLFQNLYSTKIILIVNWGWMTQLSCSVKFKATNFVFSSGFSRFFYVKDVCLILQVFEGNKDRFTIQTNVFDPAFIGRSIRIHPKEWNGHIGMRLEIYGCHSGLYWQTIWFYVRQKQNNACRWFLLLTRWNAGPVRVFLSTYILYINLAKESNCKRDLDDIMVLCF